MSYLLDKTNWNYSDTTSIPYLLVQHIYITGISLLIALLIAIPIGLIVARYQRLYLPVITIAGLIYTIPSLAAGVILLPYTGLNANTIIIPLIAYAQLVLIRNMVTAIRSVDQNLIDIGRAMGMNWWQLQTRIIIPLALPVIIAGVRVAAVTTIGIASIGSLIGANDLGDLIFDGIQLGPKHASEIYAGAILITLLALSVDLILLGVQRVLNRGRGAIAAAS